MVTCKKCGREFKSEAALKDHLRDAQVHRESIYEHKNQYRKWVLVVLVLVVICGVAIFAFSGNPSGTYQTGAPTVSKENLDTVLNNQTVKVTPNGAWISATLNPVGKLNYNVKGSMALVDCPILLGESACPTIEMWAMNQTGFANYQKSGVPVGTYGTVGITPTLDEQSPFTLHNLDYDGTYYLVFMALNQGNTLSPGTYTTVSISLTEVWS